MADQPPLTVTSVDDDGVHLTAVEDLVVDVLFDGRRIWSFWTQRDTVDGRAGWPRMLRKFLHGTARVSVVEHLSGTVVFETDVALGLKLGRAELLAPASEVTPAMVGELYR